MQCVGADADCRGQGTRKGMPLLYTTEPAKPFRCIFGGYCQAACPTGAITLEHEYKLAAFYPEDTVFHKEMLLEPEGQATVGSNAVWFEPAPPEAAQPVPQDKQVFDGSEASAAAVGLGTLQTERPVLFVNEEQDEDRRKLEHGKGQQKP